MVGPTIDDKIMHKCETRDGIGTCDKRKVGRGMCSACYQTEWKKSGPYLPPKEERKPRKKREVRHCLYCGRAFWPLAGAQRFCTRQIDEAQSRCRALYDAEIKPTCSFPGCNKPVIAHGLCQTHYQQQRRGTASHPHPGEGMRSTTRRVIPSLWITCG